MNAEMLYAGVCVAGLTGGAASILALLPFADNTSRAQVASHLLLAAALFGISAAAYVGWCLEAERRNAPSVEARP